MSVPFKHSWGWLRKWFARPPYLSGQYAEPDYLSFMREETFLYTSRYARKFVVVHDEINLRELTRLRGAVLAPLHYGSFFLSGGAINCQLGLHCTAIVTYNNLLVLPREEADFWRGVHHRTQALHRQPLFYAGITPRQEIEGYLAQPHNLLWAMLDVREAGRERPEYPFRFMQRQVYLQVGAARLACFAGVPLVPMCIQYHPEESRHHLYFGSPISPETTPIEMTQQALAQLEQYVAQRPQQFFHDFFNIFSSPLSEEGRRAG